MSSLDRILPFLRPIEDLLRDPTITEVMVNCGGRRVFVERSGALEVVPERTLEVRNLTVAIKNIARACGDEISEVQPALDARLEDGSRVAAMFPPCSVDGPTLTVRKFTHRYTLQELVGVGTLTHELAEHLKGHASGSSGWTSWNAHDDILPPFHQLSPAATEMPRRSECAAVSFEDSRSTTGTHWTCWPSGI